VKKSSCLLIVALATFFVGGCADKGSSAAPPSGFTATAGDGRVKIEWTPNPSVDYWLFTATDSSLTANNWLGLPNLVVYTKVATPFYMCGLFRGTTYYIAANGRINGGAGGSGSPTISATPYDASWLANTALSPANLYGAGYTSLKSCSNNAISAAGSFTAVGAGGAIYTSSDGMIWTNQAAPGGFITDLYAVTGYAANLNNLVTPALRWVAVGDGGASVYSLDGISWAVGNPYNVASPALHGISQFSGNFFAVGDVGTILSSTDGISWMSHTATSGTTDNLRGVYHGAIYVAVGDNGTIVTSLDGGTTWTAKTSGTTSTLRQVTSFGSIIVAVGDGGTIVTSKDNGATWTMQVLTGTPSLVGIAAEFRQVINAVSDTQLGYISTMQFVAVDNAGNAYTSVNGITWSPTGSTGIANLGNLGQPLVASGFGYVAAGNAGATAYAF